MQEMCRVPRFGKYLGRIVCRFRKVLPCNIQEARPLRREAGIFQSTKQCSHGRNQPMSL